MILGYNAMEKILLDLNKSWGLDFVSATAGDCCNTCGDMDTVEKTDAWDEAQTYLVVKWFFAGMNFTGAFEDMTNLSIKYYLGDKVSLEQVCKDLQEKLESFYEVVVPKDTSLCITLIKK